MTRPPAGAAPSTVPSTAPPSTAAPGPAHVVAAAGDIACEPTEAVSRDRCRQQATSELLTPDLTAVLTLGDNQYENGTLDKYRRSYDPSWGRVKAITRPAPGNHEYSGRSAQGYFAYFGAAAGPPGRGWYSFDVGAWHLVSLNSNCAAAGGCAPGSPQHAWLVDDLAASRSRCTLAYWHHPRFSSGFHGENLATAPFWEALHGAGAEMVLNGHDHHYERFAPLAPDGTVDPQRGVRQFVVGTGGRSLYPAPFRLPGSEVRDTSTFGVLLLTLRPDGYEARFVPEAGKTFTDQVSGRCQ